MGVPQLNQYLHRHSPNGMQELSLNDLRGKKVVVDTSIYLYKYLSEETLVESFYLMVTKFRQFGIVPLFVFDGRPPPEKYEEISARKQRKDKAHREYVELLPQYDRERCGRKKCELRVALDNLRRQFVKVTYEDIDTIKDLLRAYGVSYCVADGEADSLCAAIVSSGKAYACLSEDMDMFVYGCDRVLRYLSLLHSTVVEYDTSRILADLGVTFEEFRHICIITGCDYVKKHQRSLHSTMVLFDRYREDDKGAPTFYEWVMRNTAYFDASVDFEAVERLFDVGGKADSAAASVQILNSSPNTESLAGILAQHGFVFL